MRIRTTILLCITVCMAVVLATTQNRYRQSMRSEYPTWEIKPGFKDDVFTFVRIQYDSYGPIGRRDRWDNDHPDGDLNFSFRLQQLTSMNVNPDSKVLRLTDPELFNYPFIYMAGVQRMTLSDAERDALCKYLLNGGFVMMDDFWMLEGWINVLNEMRNVFPDKEPVELSLNHQIFHMIFDLKELPQVCDIQSWISGSTFEYRPGLTLGDEAPHFWSYYDDHGRMVALLCHNNDLGDGWEREGENKDYFHQFSETQSYPMGINILTYVMSH